MIGIYNYTVILTYLSLISASCGMIVTLTGSGHPFIGCYFLLFSGLCDAFDGKVAKTKKNRTKFEENFGIQIDSLSDIAAFGILPACIGVSLVRNSSFLKHLFLMSGKSWIPVVGRGILYAIFVLYILAAMIRLAYYNVSEQERQDNETCARKYYLGLPVTAAALIFPFVLLLQYILPADITLFYVAAVVVMGILFLSRFQIKKPELKGILLMVFLGALEFAFLLIRHLCGR